MPKARPALGLLARALRKLGLGKAPASKAAPARATPKRGRRAGQRHPGSPAQGRFFANVVIVPGSQDKTRTTIVNGGPIWPNFDRQTWPRLVRRKHKRVDVAPAMPQGQIPDFPGPAVWGGVLYPQFGHLVCEHLTRLLWSRQRWPDLPYLFITTERLNRDNLPGYVWDLIDWFGVPREQVHVITEPLRVPKLHVMPQAERLYGPPPTPAYLNLLEKRVAQMGLNPMPSDCLYVGRLGMIAAGSGANAGESYLAEQLTTLGVQLMDPTALPLRAQMEAVMGANTLIFAEGSALHGRQLLGRLPQKIHVLNRRLDHDLGRSELAARTQGIQYHKVTRRLVSMVHRAGRDIHPRGLSFYDLDVLFDALDQAGLDLRTGWDSQAYAQAVEQDARLWLARLDRPEQEHVLRDPTLKAIRAEFAAEGLTHLLDEMEAKA
ncbi:glycosyltransferase 61 family protein [Neogemmobacter tilapiae]|uniref:Glycosyltransferase 61 catalytic domain-containing protein n=1 Tax=Neogemmobacter tilapiae TaxID=875041 RepID=A0A918TQW5_9RHOB|nr:glycosyltransferase 61 family protein [Gemmobacter tilapiae]GHC52784.1 hypothetical protein GCM10007315_14190 [Gemmobacter tilapiae]